MIFRLLLSRSLRDPFHGPFNLPDHGYIPGLVDFGFPLGNHVAEDGVGGLVVVGFGLQLGTALGQDIDLGELCLYPFVADTFFFLLVYDFLPCSPPPVRNKTNRLR